MEGGASYGEALAEAQRRGFAEADPTDDVTGADAAAKMAILATVAFHSRVELADVAYAGIEAISELDIKAARELEMVVRLVGSANLIDGQVDVRVHPAFVDRHHPLASVEGAFNAVMLQGDAIREITLEGPGAGGIETASAVVADMVSVIGTMGTGFLQNDPCWRTLGKLPPGDLPCPFYFRLHVDDRPGVLAQVAETLARHGLSVARIVQHGNGADAHLHVVTHEGAVRGDAGGARRDRRAARDEGGARRAAGHLGARRRGAAVGVVARWRDRLPVTSATPDLTLGEGATPLIAAPVLSAQLDAHVFLKIEGANPTGSFKDRGMAVAMACAVGRGARAVVCASTGNTAASAAAYAARAGIEALIIHPAGAVAGAKLAQTRVVGAAVVPIEGTFDDALRLAQEAADHGYVVVNSGLQPRPDRRPAHGGLRDRRDARLGARHPRAALRRRREHRCLPVGLRGRRRRRRGSCRARRASGRRRSPRRSASASRCMRPTSPTRTPRS